MNKKILKAISEIILVSLLIMGVTIIVSTCFAKLENNIEHNIKK